MFFRVERYFLVEVMFYALVCVVLAPVFMERSGSCFLWLLRDGTSAGRCGECFHSGDVFGSQAQAVPIGRIGSVAGC